MTVGGGAPARALRDELHLGHAVHVLDPTDDVRALYAAADVFVAPSRWEGHALLGDGGTLERDRGGRHGHSRSRRDRCEHRLLRDHVGGPRRAGARGPRR